MSMDPYYEQRLRDEVLYLHSLWHQGPPNPNPNHLHSLRQQGPSRPPNPNPNNTNHTTSTQFKEPKKPTKKKAKKTPPPPTQSDLEWPCNETPAAGAARPGWPAPVPASTTRVLTPEEQAQFAATRVQNKAVAAVKAFFACDSESDDSDGDKGGEDGYGEYQFFMRLFAEEEELKEYCEENWEGGGGGAFVCLVCGGVGKIKRFKNLVAVVQHSVTIARTKRKNAHRAYAQVVCRVLGWDVDRLPTVDSKPQGNAEVAAEESRMINQDLALANVCNGKTIQKEVFDVDQEEKIPSSSNGETVQKEFFDVDQEKEIPSSSIPGISSVIGDNVMLCENSVKDGDANNCLEKLDQGPANPNPNPNHLHSLWQQGPPQPPNPDPNPNHPNLTNSTQFKEPKKSKRKKAKKTPPPSDLEWPCNETPAAGIPAPTSRVLTPEEQAHFTATRVQNKAVAAVEEFFVCDSESGDSDGDKGVMGEDGYEEYQFFMRLFSEEEELMEYCEENWEGGGGGGFVCLVCGGIGKSKSFKNLVAVVQHSVTVLRTKRKNAHRAYAQVVCRVLGWDVDRLPTIGSKPQNSVKDGDANNCLKKLDNGVQSFGDGDTAGVVTCLEHSEDNGIGNEISHVQNAIVVANELKENNGEAH